MTTFDDIFKSYFVQLCTFAYPFVKSEEIAKDIVHDAYMVFIDNPLLLEKDPLVQKSYLYTTVKNLSMNHQRKNRLEEKYTNSLGNYDLADVDLMKGLIESEVIGTLHRELDALPERCQHVCRLIYMEGKKYEEVASEMQISVNTVKSQRILALRILRKKLTSFFFLTSIITLILSYLVIF
ncbi:RNA polymerase sigma-70 factor [uncultured Sphingobacterium sp.]|uniref:RNA polymerase sigma-70 factor n=1 Tax=uncultured Sphingobacterium sp. TaxID=182688 RepID=UPI00374898EC